MSRLIQVIAPHRMVPRMLRRYPGDRHQEAGGLGIRGLTSNVNWNAAALVISTTTLPGLSRTGEMASDARTLQQDHEGENFGAAESIRQRSASGRMACTRRMCLTRL